MRQSRIRNCCFLLIFIVSTAQAQGMPLHFAPSTIVLQNDVNTDPPPHEPSDALWYHLHRGHPTLPDSSSNTIAPQIINGINELAVADSGVEMRYLVHNEVVSSWLQPPFVRLVQLRLTTFLSLCSGTTMAIVMISEHRLISIRLGWGIGLRGYKVLRVGIRGFCLGRVVNGAWLSPCFYSPSNGL